MGFAGNSTSATGYAFFRTCDHATLGAHIAAADVLCLPSVVTSDGDQEGGRRSWSRPLPAAFPRSRPMLAASGTGSTMAAMAYWYRHAIHRHWREASLAF